MTDLDRSIGFYTQVFGFAQLYQLDFNDNEVAATIEQDGRFRSARIELMQNVPDLSGISAADIAASAGQAH